MERRRFWLRRALAALCVAMCCTVGPAFAADENPSIPPDLLNQAGKTLVFAGVGGPIGNTLKTMASAFTKATGIRVTYVEGPVLDLFGRIKAEQNRPSIDVYYGNNVTESLGIEQGLYLPLDPKIVTNLADVYAVARLHDDLGVRMSFSGLGMLYNKKIYREHNIPAPTRWEDMWAPGASGHIIIGDTSDYQNQLYIAFLSRLLGGTEADPTAAIDFIAKNKPKLLAIVRTYPERMQLINSGEAWLTGAAGLVGIQETKNNPDLGFATPASGTGLYTVSLHVIKNSPNPIGAQLFVNFFLGVPMQEYWSKTSFAGPANKNVKLDDELDKLVPYGSEAVSRLVPLDGGVIGRSLQKYRDLWNQKIGAN